MLVEHGIAGILNFSPAMLSVPDHVMVKYVNLARRTGEPPYFLQAGALGWRQMVRAPVS